MHSFRLLKLIEKIVTDVTPEVKQMIYWNL